MSGKEKRARVEMGRRGIESPSPSCSERCTPRAPGFWSPRAQPTWASGEPRNAWQLRFEVLDSRAFDMTWRQRACGSEILELRAEATIRMPGAPVHSPGAARICPRSPCLIFPSVPL